MTPRKPLPGQKIGFGQRHPRPARRRRRNRAPRRRAKWAYRRRDTRQGAEPRRRLLRGNPISAAFSAIRAARAREKPQLDAGAEFARGRSISYAYYCGQAESLLGTRARRRVHLHKPVELPAGTIFTRPDRRGLAAGIGVLAIPMQNKRPFTAHFTRPALLLEAGVNPREVSATAAGDGDRQSARRSPRTRAWRAGLSPAPRKPPN